MICQRIHHKSSYRSITIVEILHESCLPFSLGWLPRKLFQQAGSNYRLEIIHAPNGMILLKLPHVLHLDQPTCLNSWVNILTFLPNKTGYLLRRLGSSVICSPSCRGYVLWKWI
ncbi:hypothetical protein ANCCAN_15574 [Ancylostoma caninum]|uniref:Uncharacterized protein n=1 Tax=Ancylostoma caninum TaxID=29170 RepID=A0A368G5C4_ANCCA|nr:hypothetical protein ANCCAN_15574 [Ancylostoma caninum]